MPLYLSLTAEAWTAFLGDVAPVIMLLLLIAIAIAILQAVFQIEDMALSFLPRLLTMIGILLISGLGTFRAIRLLQIDWLESVSRLVHQPWY